MLIAFAQGHFAQQSFSSQYRQRLYVDINPDQVKRKRSIQTKLSRRSTIEDKISATFYRDQYEAVTTMTTKKGCSLNNRVSKKLYKENTNTIGKTKTA